MPVRGHHKPDAAKFLDADSVSRLLSRTKEAGRPRDHYLFASVYYLGLRVGEAVCLEPKHFRLDSGCVFVPTLKRRKHAGTGEPPLLEVKVLDGADTLRALLAWAGNRRFVFAGARTGTHLCTRRAQELFREWADALAFHPDSTIHSLRHTACSRVFHATRDAALVRDFARHSSVAVSDRYIHNTPERWEGARGSLTLPEAPKPPGDGGGHAAGAA